VLKVLQTLSVLGNISDFLPFQRSSTLQHLLTPNPLSLAKVNGEMNSTSKADLINILTSGLQIRTEIQKSDLTTCVLIDGHALIQSIGKPPGCQTFCDYADVFMKKVTRHFGEQTTRVDVIFDRYIGENSIKASTRSKRVGKKKPIRKLVEGRHIPLPSVWSQFIALDENKADLAKFLSQIIIAYGNDLSERYELVTGGGFADATDVCSTRREDVRLRGDHEEADTRLILHSCEAINSGYKRLLVICQDTDVMLLLVHFTALKDVEVWMISGTAKNRKCFPIHSVSAKLSTPVRDNLLSFHALTGCDTTSSFSGYGKKSCWNTFYNQPLLVKGIGRDGELSPIEQFVCKLYGTPDIQTVDHARIQLFGKAKKGLEMLPPTRDALELHVARANHQAKIWLQADQEHIHVSSPIDTLGWKTEFGCLRAVWTRLPPVPDGCLQLVTCGCKSKCRTARCTCYLKNLQCISACGCDAIDCCNPAY
jgi:hypothetical protein